MERLKGTKNKSKKTIQGEQTITLLEIYSATIITKNY